MSGSGWFRRQPTLPAAGGAPAAKRIWQRTKASGVPRPTKKRGVALTATSAVLVLGAGVTIVAFATPGSHASLVSSAAPVAAHKPLQPAADLQLVSMSPTAGTRGVNGTSPIRVQFSAPLAASSPMPALSPSIPGNWTVQGDDAVFTPTVGYLENTKVTVKIPGGPAGMISAAGAKVGDGGTLGSDLSQSFTTGSFSTMRLQQLLAQLGYLPLTWTSESQPRSARPTPGPSSPPPTARQPGPSAGRAGYPWNLTSQWKAGSDNILDVGAIRAFESVQGLTMDGRRPRRVGRPAQGRGPRQAEPQRVHLRARQPGLPGVAADLAQRPSGASTSPANTGIPASPTADGTFPVYLRYYFRS